MLTVVEAEPPEVLAQTVNIVVVMLTSGVPEITPLLKFRPSGRAGSIVHTSTSPPDTVGDSGVIETLRVSVMLYGL